MIAKTQERASRTEDQLLTARLDNLLHTIYSGTPHIPAEKKQKLVTLPDREFLAELLREVNMQAILNTKSREQMEQEEYAENRLAFLDVLRKDYGGIHKSTAVKDILQISIPTVNKKGEKGELIALASGAENLYPVFQFSTDEKLSEKGMLKGVPALLAAFRQPLSAVRKCNFFTRAIELPGSGEKTSVLAVLRRGATPEEMKHFLILAENFGTQNAV